MPTEAHQSVYALYIACEPSLAWSDTSQRSSMNVWMVSDAERYSMVAFRTACGIPKPCRCHNWAPSTAHCKIAGNSALSFSARPLSAFEASNDARNGTRRIRRQMPLSVPRTTGLWLVASTILPTGWSSKNSLCRNRTEIASPPVKAFTMVSSKAAPCLPSGLTTNLRPASAAKSLRRPSFRFVSMNVDTSTCLAYEPISSRMVLMKVDLPLEPKP